jgi:2-isopropylmalate synthase
MMLKNPASKYAPVKPIALPDRSWPNRVLTRPPLWCSSDLRDGNQALIEPMDRQRKRRMFDLLVTLGFKQIEVAFPSASQTEFDFVRSLIEDSPLPDDVTIQVLTPAREELIARTFASVRGARRAIVHFYNAVAPVFRRVVFGKPKGEIIEMAVRAAQLFKTLAAEQPGTAWTFEYSPEAFSATELDFAKEITDAVVEVWDPTPERKVIVNLPATVEMSTPNIYADQIEWMNRNLRRREALILSLHPHNDRGTAVAAAELALMAGADRVEGCLFGNGERTGNVDLVTLALNLYTQGIDPGLDLSQIDEVRRTAELCNQLPVHPRHPYAGDLVYTAFSGSHQDAIKKGLAARSSSERSDMATPGGSPTPPATDSAARSPASSTRWEVPYLPIDPADVGRRYDAVIRVNSQSGKGGVAYLLATEHGFELPRRLQIELAREVQTAADSSGKEISGAEIFALFDRAYLQAAGPYRYRRHRVLQAPANAGVRMEVELEHQGTVRRLEGMGNGPIDAVVAALGLDLKILDYHEHAMSRGAAADAAAYIEVALSAGPPFYGVGRDGDIVTASIKAIISALNRAAR